jgi:hypothetical protein
MSIRSRPFFARIIFGVLVLASASLAFSEEVDWLNTAPSSGRRISPEPGAILNHDPVAFFWPMVDGALAYTLSINGNASKLRIRTTTNYHVLAAPLSEGIYAWQVVAHVPGKSLAGAARSFEMRAPIIRLGETDPSRLIGVLSGSARPRFFPKGEEWRAVSSSLSSSRRVIVETIIKRSTSKPRAVQSVGLLNRGTQLSPVDRVSIKREATLLCNDLEDTAFLWRLTRDERWQARAREIISVIGSIDHPALYGDPYDLLSARFILWARVIAYDWMFDALDPRERDELRGQIEKGVLWLHSQLLDPQRGLGRAPFDSHASEVIGAVLVGAASIVGEKPSATAVFKALLPLYLTDLLPSVSSDGGAGTSGTYTIWDVGAYNVPHWDAIRWSTGLDIAALTQVRRLGDWLSRSAPPAAPAVWWGDGAETLRRVEWEGVAHLLASRSGEGLLPWYVARIGAPKYPLVWHALAPAIGRTSALSVPATTPTPTFNVYPLAGLAILNTDIANPNAASVYFRSSPFGSAIHGHYDQNAFVLSYQGRLLAIDSGAYDYWGSEQYFRWYKRTVAHNAITWDGGVGQEGNTIPRGNLDASGRLVDFGEKSGVAYVVGEAAHAYGPDVTRARRTIAYLPDGVVAVFDDLVANTARRWEWNLHATSAKLQGDKAVEISSGPANACIDLYGEPAATIGIARRQSPGVDREWGMSSHDHVVFGQTVASKQARFVAFVRLDCKVISRSVTFGGGVVNIQVGRSKILLNQQNMEISTVE